MDDDGAVTIYERRLTFFEKQRNHIKIPLGFKVLLCPVVVVDL